MIGIEEVVRLLGDNDAGHAEAKVGTCTDPPVTEVAGGWWCCFCAPVCGKVGFRENVDRSLRDLNGEEDVPLAEDLITLQMHEKLELGEGDGAGEIDHACAGVIPPSAVKACSLSAEGG